MELTVDQVLDVINQSKETGRSQSELLKDLISENADFSSLLKVFVNEHDDTESNGSFHKGLNIDWDDSEISMRIMLCESAKVKARITNPTKSKSVREYLKITKPKSINELVWVLGRFF